MFSGIFNETVKETYCPYFVLFFFKTMARKAAVPLFVALKYKVSLQFLSKIRKMFCSSSLSFQFVFRIHKYLYSLSSRFYTICRKLLSSSSSASSPLSFSSSSSIMMIFIVVYKAGCVQTKICWPLFFILDLCNDVRQQFFLSCFHSQQLQSREFPSKSLSSTFRLSPALLPFAFSTYLHFLPCVQ